MFINCSTCFEWHTAHHQELKNCNCSLWFYIRLWLPAATTRSYLVGYFYKICVCVLMFVCLIVCYLETSTMRQPRPDLDCCVIKKMVLIRECYLLIIQPILWSPILLLYWWITWYVMHVAREITLERGFYISCPKNTLTF